MTTRTNTPQGRKRTRSQAEDEPPSLSSIIKKRRRKETDGQEKDSTPEKVGLLSAATWNAVTPGRRSASKPNRVTSSKRKLSGGSAVWEIPDSEDEALRNDRLSSKPVSGQKKPQPSNGREKSAVYDIPDSGDELTKSEETPRLPRQKKSNGVASELKSAASVKGNDSGRRTRGIPRNGPAEEVQDISEPFDTPSKPRSSRKLGLPKVAEPENAGTDSDVAPSLAMPKTRTRQQKDPVDALKAENSLMPKGILTPTKQNGIRRQKSVAFNSSAGKKQNEVTFEDVVSRSAGPSSRSAQQRKQSAQEKKTANSKPAAASSESEAEEEEEDDEVCAVCSKPDSRRGNEIVFCDGCDMAVHQKCYGLRDIPEGDWLCRNCSQEEVATLAPGAAASVQGKDVCKTAQTDQIPDIPNFEHHLHGMQRILLDRCTGRRRIKLIGQDEALEKASQLVEQTIVAGEGNSMLVIGARGCGKTTVS